MTTQPAHSRSLPITLVSVGAGLLALAAFLWFLGPKFFVEPYYNQEVEFTEEDMYWETIQSGQPAEMPGNFNMTISPQWVWNDPAVIEAMNAGENPTVDIQCSVTGPDGAALEVKSEPEMMSATFTTRDAGSYTVECDKGGMLDINGEDADLYAHYATGDRNAKILSWSSFASLLLGIGLLVPGSYVLGVRQERRRALERAAFAGAVAAPAPYAGPVSGEPAPEGNESPSSLEATWEETPAGSAHDAQAATVSSGPAPTGAPGAAPGEPSGPAPATPGEFAQSSESYVVRRREPKPKRRDPFDED